MQTWKTSGEEFTIRPDGLAYLAADGRDALFPFKNPLRLRVSPWTGELRLANGRVRASLAGLPPDQLREFLPAFFRAWNAVNPNAARKAGFDYVDAQKGFVSVAFVSCLLVSLPMAIALFADSHQQFRCTQMLRAGSVPGVMQVTKARKRSSRTFLLNLEFTAPSGKVIKGQEEVLTEKDVPPPMQFSIAYSPEQPECWSLTKAPDNPEVNWARRRYFAAFGFLFGLFFLGVTVLGFAWCAGKWLRPRPFAEEVRAVFQFS